MITLQDMSKDWKIIEVDRILDVDYLDCFRRFLKVLLNHKLDRYYAKIARDY